MSSDQKILIAALTEFQTKLEKVDTYDHVVFPPVYKQVYSYILLYLHFLNLVVVDISLYLYFLNFYQVVSFAVYIYFGLSLIGEQELKNTPEILPYFPAFLVLKFIFFFGWLEVVPFC